MNKTRLVSLAALLVLALPLSACTGMLLGGGGSAGRPIGSGTEGAQAGDLQIEATIRARFSASSVLDDSNLNVESRGGVVTLRGTVPAYAARDHAQRLASDVDGVVRVSNQIQISR